MKALLIHQLFADPKQPGGTRHFELASHVVKSGHDLTVVASDLSYLTGEPVVQRTGLFTERDMQGIRVLYAYTHRKLHSSFAWRVVSYLSFVMSSTWAGLRVGPIDVVMGTSPPIFQFLSAWVVATLRRRPLLLEVRDLWPEFAVAMGVLTNPIIIKLARWAERFFYAQATHILVNSPAYRDYLIDYGVPADKISLIPNGVDPDMFDPCSDGAALRGELGLDGQFVVTYAGALGQANDIGTILRAADHLRDQPNVHFLLVGDGKEKTNLQRLADELSLPNVTFAGTYSKSRMAEVLAASDVCVATLMNIPAFRTTYPNKVFDYMAAGRPTVLAIDGVIREVVEAAGAGVFVSPGDDVALAGAVREMHANAERARAMGRAGRDYVAAHFNRHHHARQFVQLLERLDSPKSAPGRGSTSTLYRRFGKRALDLALSVTAALLLCPLIILVGLLVQLKLGRPAVFRQRRPGRGGRPFTLYKYRSMNDDRDADGNLLDDGQRLTPFGTQLRRLSLDELPQLWNIIKGDMSLVGPRPLLMQYLDRYTPEQARRHEVTPGITGWAQVRGRNSLAWEKRFELDVWYADHVSFALDMKILWLTLLSVLSRKGVSAEGHATMPEFMGTKSS